MNRYSNDKPFGNTLGGLAPEQFSKVMLAVKREQRNKACPDCTKKDSCKLRPRFGSLCFQMEVKL